ncbi:hypothetical protein B0F90DRAFT_571146 [Multifurca ochricompacta]|uniref:Uncharacterized protein n=1 Tax=Multifurca ochricompacta TaxID=376703 RepID=A0AAD4M2Q2_9AGAM|nr:hypothetical protein B0F90DRAFT_571146 [Multifurca ochricompacta]
MPSSLVTSAPKNPPKFDRLGFVKYMKNIGRAYRKQAMELISICRLFVQAEEQSIDAGKELRNSLQVVDDALSSATDPNKKDSEKVDALEAAVQALSNYESKFHHRDSDRTVSKRMEAVKKKHESSSKIWDTMKQKLRERERPTEAERSEPTTVVEFLLLKSPLDPKPSIVKQVISKTSSISEILWNFSRFRDERRVTLKQNPHFYMNLPTSAEAYGDGFKIDPMKDLQHVPKICVLTDKPSRVFLETDETTRTFSNFWIPSRAIIFKDVCGKLEGESVVGAAIQGKPNLWYREEPPTPTTPQPEVGPTANLASHSGLSPNTATSPTSSIAGRTFHDWKELIRQTLDSHHISIRISTKQNQTPPGPSDDWVLSSPISPSPASLGQPSPMVQTIPVGTMSFSIGLDKTRASLSIQIPVPSAGLQLRTKQHCPHQSLSKRRTQHCRSGCSLPRHNPLQRLSPHDFLRNCYRCTRPHQRGPR